MLKNTFTFIFYEWCYRRMQNSDDWNISIFDGNKEIYYRLYGCRNIRRPFSIMAMYHVIPVLRCKEIHIVFLDRICR